MSVELTIIKRLQSRNGKRISVLVLLIAVLVMLNGCSSDAETPKPEISNFQFGMVCPADVKIEEGRDYQQTPGIAGGSICEETSKVFIKGNQRCIFDGRSIPCTWYGYEFDYKNIPDGSILSCTFKTTIAGAHGNPDKVLAEDSKTGSFTLTIPDGKDHFYNPLYSGYIVLAEGQNKDYSEIICSLDGQELYRYNMETIYPTRHIE